MKRVYRNYCSDMPYMYMTVYKAMCECFDKHQDESSNGVEYSVMMSYIMMATKGSINPMIVQEILKEFEK